MIGWRDYLAAAIGIGSGIYVAIEQTGIAATLAVIFAVVIVVEFVGDLIRER